MQRREKNPVIKQESEWYICAKCGEKLVYWRTKADRLVYECERCGWAEVEE